MKRLLAICFSAWIAAAAHAEPIAQLPFESKASHYVLMDADTGSILAAREADAQMYPSSMTKLMTLYILFEELKAGRLSLEDRFLVSEKAWAKKGSKMFVPLGKKVSIEQLIRGISVQSGNDACIVVAEGISGSEDAFAARMNETAKALGMNGTHFTNASGWPDENHYTTARDLAILANAMIRHFPDYYAYLAEQEFTYNNIRQFNRNRLLGRPGLGVDGLKTGHTEAAGYGIVLSAKQSDNMRLILVINGLPSEAAREEEGAGLLGWGFANFAQVTIARAGEEVGRAPVRFGTSDVALVAATPIRITVPRTKQNDVVRTTTLKETIQAPVTKGDVLGVMRLSAPDVTEREVPLIAAHDVAKKGFFGRIPELVGGLFDGKK
jgi:D-alanyl-D-alanine carboxypeptidase (penicillin-binding protein 5/6)